MLCRLPLLLQAPVHKDLHPIFSHYCKSIEPSKAVAGLRMGFAELLLLLRDCSVMRIAYGEERVKQVWPRWFVACPLCAVVEADRSQVRAF
jgi:hypothetical protein